MTALKYWNNESISIMFPNTANGVGRLQGLDSEFAGTEDYMGLWYFWNHEYRHYMRDASPYHRKLVHNAFMKAGLDISGKSEAHADIVVRYLGP